MPQDRKVWKVRVVKPYAKAHTHLIIGEVLQDTPTWLRIKGRTYHFGRTAERPRDIKVGNNSVRIIPWSRIEIANELPSSFEYAEAKLTSDGKGNVGLKHAGCVVLIISRQKQAE